MKRKTAKEIFAESFREIAQKKSIEIFPYLSKIIIIVAHNMIVQNKNRRYFT